MLVFLFTDIEVSRRAWEEHTLICPGGRAHRIKGGSREISRSNLATDHLRPEGCARKSSSGREGPVQPAMGSSPEPVEGRPGGRFVSAEFGPRARNPVERRLAKREYTLYPSHLTEAGLTLHHEELSPFMWGLQVYYRVALKPGEAALESFGEERT